MSQAIQAGYASGEKPKSRLASQFEQITNLAAKAEGIEGRLVALRNRLLGSPAMARENEKTPAVPTPVMPQVDETDSRITRLAITLDEIESLVNQLSSL